MPEIGLDALARIDIKPIAKTIGVELATKPDLVRTVEFTSTSDWLSHVESSRLSQTPVADVARIDASLGYIQELKRKSTEALQHKTSISITDVEKFSGQYKDAVEQGIEKSTNLVDDLTAIPNDAEPNQLAASIVKARVLGDVHRVMQTPDTHGGHPSLDEALTQVEAGMSGSRQRIIENAISDTSRIVRNPDTFYQGDASTWEEWTKETSAFAEQAKSNLGQLEILDHTNYYTQAGNRAERIRAIFQAIDTVADPSVQTVYARQERLQTLIDYSEKYGLLQKMNSQKV